MKFELYHDKTKKSLTVPAAALKLSWLGDAETLQLDAGNGGLFIAKDKMSAREVIAVVDFLSALATDYIVKLASACGVCDDCGFCEMEDEDEAEIPQQCRECGEWRHGCESSISIPLCTLEEAGIDPNAGVEVFTEDGRIVIAAIDDEDDPLDELSPILRYTLESAGVCMESLRELLTSGEPIHG